MRKFSHSHELPAPAATVLDLITREDYLRFRYDDTRLLGFDLEISEDSETAFAYCVERVIDPGDSLPAVARRLVGNRFTLRQQARWSRQGPPYAGQLTVTVPGMPGRIEGGLQLRQINGHEQSRIDSDGRIEVNIPLAGGQLERMLVGVAEETFAESMRQINAYIAHANAGDQS